MEAVSEPKAEPWHVERKVPIAIIVALAVQLVAQLVGAAWWASGTSARLDVVEKQLAASAPQAVSIAKLETKFDSMVASLAEIKEMLRRPSVSR